MGKKKKESNLGKMLIRDRFGQRKQRVSGDTFLHTTELNDGYDWGRLNLQSVTEQSNLDDFLATAELAGTEFTAEKLNIKFVDPNKNSGVLSETEQANVECLQEQHKNLLRIPRRPQWDSTTSPEQLDSREKASFLEWRKGLNVLSEVEGILLTPYERNLDFWRQLWRVIERSDVVVQIVDARNPLLFRCEDVDAYVKEVNPTKINLLLVNKADLLTREQRQMWCDYFTENNILVAFWSALAETERQKEKLEEISSGDEMEDENESDESYEDSDEDSLDEDIEDKDLENEKLSSKQMSDEIEKRLQDTSVTDQVDSASGGENLNSNNLSCDLHSQSEETEQSCGINSQTSEKSETSSRSTLSNDETSGNENSTGLLTGDNSHKNTPEILLGEELLKLLRSLHEGPKAHEGQTTIGMVGYPNVGKSSTINAILKMKKVPVSATPGRTKHFQTLYVEKDLMLCDCPGLVFPSFVSTKAELVVNGILPIDQMRDHVPPVSLVCHYIPKQILEEMYGINLPLPQEGEDPERPPTADELLNSYGTMRGFMTSNGLPDCPRTSRYILKDFVNGKLLYCNNPPGTDPDEFHCACTVIPEEKKKVVSASLKASGPKQSKLDRDFFIKAQSKAHSKGVQGVANFARMEGVRQIGTETGTSSPGSSVQSLNAKPWKKHNNMKKREKLRRLYKDHDDD